MALTNCVTQRRALPPIWRVYISLLVNQRGNYRQVTDGRSEMKRCALVVVRGVDRHATAEYDVHLFERSCLGKLTQLAARLNFIEPELTTCCPQRLCNSRVALTNCVTQRRALPPIWCIHVCALINQSLCY